MSSMLDQAIIDAGALREAAMKNAESEILEKYSQEIKEAVSTLLEQTEEDVIADPEMADMGAEASGVDEQFINQMPNSAISGMDVAGLPYDNELVEINFTELVAEGYMAEEDIDEGMLGPLGQAAVAGVKKGAKAVGKVAKKAAGGAVAGLGKGISSVGKDITSKGDEFASDDDEDLEEVIDIDENDLADLVEELVFNAAGPSPNGWASAPTAEVEEAQEVERVRKEIEEETAKSEKLEEELDQHRQQNNKFKRIILELKDKLDEVSLENARLLYTNRVLKSASLNERQKNKIVESISSAKTIEEAKVIFETLQSTVDGTPRKRMPKSLDEAVTRGSSRLYHIGEQKSVSDPTVERLQRLAGISKIKGGDV